ncbi:MAG: ABC transporter ATP-binding protein, partial [Candidatus Sumerlaeaceae bacterium]|nr:ABC transporter ATP-binding protein [Candidatus Sumerlaeaceae bacterium]
MITFHRVTKAFRIQPPSHGSALQRVARRVKWLVAPRYHEVLRDISLEIPEGDSVALLGINGSGKTTFLRLVCGITPPTSGQLLVMGRAGGLIELTAGFHLDLTGIENIYLNATLLGLSRKEIRRRLDQILEFAELGDFIHTPVRHYSWGMMLRLGFAIAIHADLDVLVVDEALAVGDGYFQWKCLKRIDELKRAGKTLLFVSHVPAQAESVCRRAIWIHDGTIRADGEAAGVSKMYADFIIRRLAGEVPSDLPLDLVALMPHLRFGTGYVVIREVRLMDREGRTRHLFETGEPAILECVVEAQKDIEDLCLVFQFDLPNRTVVKTSTHHTCGPFCLSRGTHVILSLIHISEPT